MSSLVDSIRKDDSRPRAVQMRDMILMEETELESLPIPAPGSPVALTLDLPPPLYLKAYRRALVIATKVAALRAVRKPSAAQALTLDTRRACAQVTAEFALWDVAGRAERKKRNWPTSREKFCSARGITENTLDTALDLCRYGSWIHKYRRDNEAEQTRNVDDILYAKIEEQAEVAPQKVNAKLFDTYYRRRGHIAPREGNKSVTLNVTATPEERAQLLERARAALPYVTGDHDAADRTHEPVPAGDAPLEGGLRPDREAAPGSAGLEEGEPGELRAEA